MTLDEVGINNLLNESQGAVTIPPGGYMINSPVIVPPKCGKIYAGGVKIITSKSFVGEAAVIASGVHQGRIKNCTISDLIIDCRGRSIVGFKSSYSHRLILRDLHVYNTTECGVLIHNAWDAHIVNGYFDSCGSPTVPAMIVTGDVTEHGGRTVTISDLTIQRFYSAMLLVNQKSVRVRDCKFEGRHSSQGPPASQLAIKIVGCDQVQITNPLFILLEADIETDRSSRGIIVTSPINRLFGSTFGTTEEE